MKTPSFWLRLVVAVFCFQFIIAHQEGPCDGESKFIVVDNKVKFSQVRSGCQALNGTPAVPFTSSENDKVIELASVFPPREEIWLGTSLIIQLSSAIILGFYDKDRGGDDPSRFEFDDPTSTNITFFKRKGELPWQSGQPDDHRDKENCVE